MNNSTSRELLLLSAMVFSLLANAGRADTVFLDDFEDGSFNDGIPVTWLPGSSDQLTIEDGKLVITTVGYGQAAVISQNLTDTSLRTKMKRREGEYLGVAVRDDPSQPPGEQNYYGYAWPFEDEVGIGWGGDPFSVLDRDTFQMAPTDEIFMQLDAFGDQISLWVWKVGDPLPHKPIASGTDELVTEGDILVWVAGDLQGPPELAIAEFDFVHVADTSIPFYVEDFNVDGVLNCTDIDALVAAIADPMPDPAFDITGDGMVDLADRDAWLAAAGAANLASGNSYLLGDANLDGVVDGEDFIIWNNNKFTSTAAWCSGDFNADGFVDGQDFIEWNNNKFMSSDGVSVVPEPGMGVSLIAALIGLAVVRRRDLA